MITLTIALKIIITSILGYITLNSFFKYHFSINRITLLYVIILLGVMIFFIDTENLVAFLITTGIGLVLYVVTYLIFYKKRIFGYFLFNTFKKDYNLVKDDIIKIAEELEINKDNICYNETRPFLFVIRNELPKKARSLTKKLDKIYCNVKKTFTMYNYWLIVVFFVLITILWRF